MSVLIVFICSILLVTANGYLHTSQFSKLKNVHEALCRTRMFANTNIDDSKDVYYSFSAIDKVLFSRFSASVANEMGDAAPPQSYSGLISMISQMVRSRPTKVAHDQGKNILVKLFPRWLLDQYKVMFSKPFPAFSSRMNAWVTHWTTNWLMGNSTVYDIILPNGQIEIQQGVKVDKCRFLEESACLSTCIHACKIPTQRFFLEDMGLPMTITPNVTDYSCKFEFGHVPLPLEQDPISKEPCIALCTDLKRAKKISKESSTSICLD
eukprot:gene10601-22136_t